MGHATGEKCPKTKWKGKVSLSVQMARNMKETGWIIRKMDMEFRLGTMVKSILENFKRINTTGKVHLNGLMVKNTLECGKMGNRHKGLHLMEIHDLVPK